MSCEITLEQLRRHTATMATLQLLRDAPGRWIHWRRFAIIAACAWRTRLSEARKIARADGGDVQWNRRVRRSAYRYLPYSPLGRDAAERLVQKSLFG